MKFKLVEQLNEGNNNNLVLSSQDSEEIKYYNNPEYDTKGNQLSYEQHIYFQNSQIRDREGHLIICYHFTDNDFDEFDHGRSYIGASSYGLGFYFTNTENKSSSGVGSSKVLECYLNIEHPQVMHAGDSRLSHQPIVNGDGVIVVISQDEFYYVATHREQIKLISNKKPTKSKKITENNINLNETIKQENKKPNIIRDLTGNKNEI